MSNSYYIDGSNFSSTSSNLLDKIFQSYRIRRTVFSKARNGVDRVCNNPQIFVVMDIRRNRKIITANSIESSLSASIGFEFPLRFAMSRENPCFDSLNFGNGVLPVTTVDGLPWNYMGKIYLKSWKCCVIAMNSLCRVMIRHYATFCSWQVNELCFLETCLIITVFCILFNSQAKVLHILLLIQLSPAIIFI